MRVELPDRPGSLGQVARTLGVVGADIVSVIVLERSQGRAVDDFTVVWPASALVGRILVGLGAVPGVRVVGVWRCTELPAPIGRDVALLGQVAADAGRGLATLVDGIPGLVAADWAAVTSVDPAWAGAPASAPLTVRYASWGAPLAPAIPDIAPLRPRAVTSADGTHYVAVPLQKAGLVLVAARGGPDGPGRTSAADGAIAPPFHASEVDRMGQLVNAAVLVLGDHLAPTEIVEAA
ncbi:amino acid-binding protein [Virgisporangium aurantiacum]|uniref:amino acid-binding protein n=1 Tax=Virgisporangium aurantiacum TaxID=175570 RepID=UPI0027E40409|nr:amino acid-binding protein [Virgisporangium aurantiacum]